MGLDSKIWDIDRMTPIQKIQWNKKKTKIPFICNTAKFLIFSAAFSAKGTIEKVQNALVILQNLKYAMSQEGLHFIKLFVQFSFSLFSSTTFASSFCFVVFPPLSKISIHTWGIWATLSSFENLNYLFLKYFLLNSWVDWFVWSSSFDT